MKAINKGHQAEVIAGEYLKQNGFKVLDINWKNRFCEIDIVAEKNKTIYFVEAKYRRSPEWGSGLEYITPKKLKQMTFAAEFWVASNKWRGAYQLSAIELTGDEPTVTTFLPSI